MNPNQNDNLCQDHDKKLKLFCLKSECKKKICTKCVNLHPQHLLINFKELCDQSLEKFENEEKTINKIVEKNNIDKINLEKEISQNDENIAKWMKKIEDLKKDMNKFLELKIKEFLERNQGRIENVSLILKNINNIDQEIELKKLKLKEEVKEYNDNLNLMSLDWIYENNLKERFFNIKNLQIDFENIKIKEKPETYFVEKIIEFCKNIENSGTFTEELIKKQKEMKNEEEKLKNLEIEIEESNKKIKKFNILSTFIEENNNKLKEYKEKILPSIVDVYSICKNGKFFLI